MKNKRMIPVKTYFSNHSLQQRDVYTLLQNYKEKITWSEKQKIIDIGCGPGYVMHEYLLPLIPSIGELVGIDISKSMIDFAKTQYSNLYLNFEIMSIAESEIVEKYKSYFDSAFSFYCLHWVQDQRRAMKNLYSILRPGGETLFIIAVNSINYLLYEILAESSTWAPYMRDYKDFISPYRDSADPVSDITNLMQSLGFQVDDCIFELFSYTFPSKQRFYKWVNGLNPFRKNIPAHLLEEFDQASKKILFSDDSCTLNEKTDEVTLKYSTITVFALKKLHSRSSRPSLPKIISDEEQKLVQLQTDDERMNW